MYTRLIAPLCCAAAVAFACGPRPHAAANAFPVLATRASRAELADMSRDDARRRDAGPGENRRGGTRGAGVVSSALDVRVGAEVSLALTVTNGSGKQTEINFPSGQMYDFRVLDGTGREVWRWSRGRIFTQSLQNRLLDDGETLTFSEHWAAHRAHGNYTAVATLMSNDFPMERRADFVMP